MRKRTGQSQRVTGGGERKYLLTAAGLPAGSTSSAKALRSSHTSLSCAMASTWLGSSTSPSLHHRSSSTMACGSVPLLLVDLMEKATDQ